MSTYRIGSGAGYAGDRIDPAQDLAQRGALNALVFECLAERTIALAQLRRQADPATGFDPMLAARMRAVLPACVANGTTIITNMGAANPLAAGQAVLAVARELGLPHLRVAVVTGDDVLGWMQTHDVPLLDSPHTVRSLDGQLISANAYLGADALLPALASGAHVVIAGRVADPALFLAPLIHHHGWAADDWHRLGAGLAVGHLLECAAQVSGGYLADPGHVDVPNLHRVGFPLAEVAANGDATITKLPGTGGRVDRLSCTAQLLYEVEDPAHYLQPDVVGNFAQVQLTQTAPDRVLVQGATGHLRPEQLKVTLGYREGFMGDAQISYAGPGAQARGELALAILAHRLADASLPHGLAGLEHRAELIGVNAMHGPAGDRACAGDEQAGPRHEPQEVRVRLAVRCPTRAQAEAVGQEVEALYLNGPASGGGVTQWVREVVAVASALIPRSAVSPQCHMLEHVMEAEQAPATPTATAKVQPDPAVAAHTVSAPQTKKTLPTTLRDVALARSGDKGNRATLSVVALDPTDYPPLARLLTAERVQAHYAGVVLGEVQRYTLPHLGAVHFVMHRALAGGVTRSLALDAHGKTLSSAILGMAWPG